MAGVGPTDLFDLAAEYLAACVESLDTVPTYAPALGGAPVRTFVNYGVPVADFATQAVTGSTGCDQLTVHVMPITERAGEQAGFVSNVMLVATIFRCCLPTVDDMGNAPTPQSQSAWAEQILADKWSLWNHLHFLVREGELFDKCCAVVWNGINALNPSGGCGGSTVTVTVCFDGYEEILGT